MGGVLSKDEILGAQDIKRVEVDCPEWGGSVMIQSMNGTQRDAFDAWCVANKPNNMGMRAMLVMLCAVDQNGRPLFSETDLPMLQEKNGDVLTRLFMAAHDINSLGRPRIEELKQDLPKGQSA